MMDEIKAFYQNGERNREELVELYEKVLHQIAKHSPDFESKNLAQAALGDKHAMTSLNQDDPLPADRIGR